MLSHQPEALPPALGYRGILPCVEPLFFFVCHPSHSKAGGVHATQSFAQPNRLQYQQFRGLLGGGDKILAKAAKFATKIDAEKLQSISVTEWVVTVWYWE